MLGRCWWRMLEKNVFGDKFEILPISYWRPIWDDSNRSITFKKSLIYSICHQHHNTCHQHHRHNGNIAKRTAFCICCRSSPFWSDIKAILLGLLPITIPISVVISIYLICFIIQACDIIRQIIVNNAEQTSPGSPISITTGIGAHSTWKGWILGLKIGITSVSAIFLVQNLELIDFWPFFRA